MNGIIQILKLLEVTGSIVGRKKLQKLVYILQCQGFDFCEEFGYLHYGPYSSKLANEMDALKSTSLIKEEPEQGVFETFVYKPSETLPAFLKDVKQDGIPPWAELAKQLNAQPTPLLEAVSTILYLERRGFSHDALKARFAELKPKLQVLTDPAIAFVGRLKNT